MYMSATLGHAIYSMTSYCIEGDTESHKIHWEYTVKVNHYIEHNPEKGVLITKGPTQTCSKHG